MGMQRREGKLWSWCERHENTLIKSEFCMGTKMLKPQDRYLAETLSIKRAVNVEKPSKQNRFIRP